MREAARLRIREVDVRECAVKNRLAFRFGNVTATQGRQVVLRARIELEDGRSTWGAAAEALAGAWYNKSPALTEDQKHDQLRLAIELASRRYIEQDWQTAFGHFESAYGFLNEQCARWRMPALMASYGAALLDRCVLDALGRLTGESFYDLVRGNAAGVHAAPLAPDLAGIDLATFLHSLSPAKMLHVRHTVGLVDPIVAADQPAGSGPNDGLPETLEQVAATYRHRYYKIKVGGEIDADLQRLAAIASVLDAQGTPYQVTLDGNEQYRDVATVVELLQALARTQALQRFYASILWLEQPLARDVALAGDVRAIAALKPVIIDESDADLDAFPSAIALGYGGVSSKDCKGLYKSILNRARCEVRNGSETPGRYFMSAEDLTTLPGISLQQDLALVSLLGLAHVEKNAHHFVDGMRHRPQREQRSFTETHPDLYRLDTLADGSHVSRLNIAEGQVAIASLAVPGHSYRGEVDWDSLEPAPASRWRDTMKDTA
jgi:hypothetical protein